jgi:RimJ/RimL family protein N-acetyltransferase
LGRALIAYGFDVAGFDHMIAFTSPENLASQRVMQKIGMAYEGHKIIRGEACVVYRIVRAHARA